MENVIMQHIAFGRSHGDIEFYRYLNMQRVPCTMIDKIGDALLEDFFKKMKWNTSPKPGNDSVHTPRELRPKTPPRVLAPLRATTGGTMLHTTMRVLLPSSFTVAPPASLSSPTPMTTRYQATSESSAPVTAKWFQRWVRK